MYDELTQKDIQKMQEEIEYRRLVVRKEALEAVKEARAHGDLSENFEYHAAKKDKNQNESRIRYLERMVRTAKVIDPGSQADQVGLFDQVTVFNEKLQREMTFRIVTTLRADTSKGLVSKESPVGKALLGHRAGDRVQVEGDPQTKYFVEIRAIEKGTDDESLDISSY